mgnify:CR=1 FL=1
MSQEEILQKVCSIVSEQLSVESAEVKSDSNFQNDLGADSVILPSPSSNFLVFSLGIMFSSPPVRYRLQPRLWRRIVLLRLRLFYPSST